MAHYLIGKPKELQAIRAALAEAEGLPRRATVVGGPDLLPTEYVEGAPGWTVHVCGEPIEAEDGTAAMEIPEVARKYLGEKLSHEKNTVVLPDSDKLVAHEKLPAKFVREVSEEDEDPKVVKGGRRK